MRLTTQIQIQNREIDANTFLERLAADGLGVGSTRVPFSGLPGAGPRDRPARLRGVAGASAAPVAAAGRAAGAPRGAASPLPERHPAAAAPHGGVGQLPLQ